MPYDVPYGAPPMMEPLRPNSQMTEHEILAEAMGHDSGGMAPAWLVNKKNFDSWLASAPASQNIENRSGDPRWDPPPVDPAPPDLYEPPTVKSLESSTKKLTPAEQAQVDRHIQDVVSAFAGYGRK
jgi:hypothetical protein